MSVKGDWFMRLCVCVPGLQECRCPPAAVEVMEHNGMNVYVPDQKCCGMPSLLEGDRKFTFELAAFNLEKLGEAVDEGYDIVCSCSVPSKQRRNLV